MRFSPFQCILLLYVLFLVDLERMGLSMSKKVAVIMGSDSDFPTVSPAIKRLKGFGIPVAVKVMSAHRTPDAAAEFSRTAREQGFGVIIAAAGKRPTWPACWRPTPPCRSSASR